MQFKSLTFFAAVLKASLWAILGFSAFSLLISSLHLTNINVRIIQTFKFMVYFAVYAHKICVVKILLDEAVISRWCPLSLLWG